MNLPATACIRMAKPAFSESLETRKPHEPLQRRAIPERLASTDLNSFLEAAELKLQKERFRSSNAYTGSKNRKETMVLKSKRERTLNRG